MLRPGAEALSAAALLAGLPFDFAPFLRQGRQGKKAKASTHAVAKPMTHLYKIAGKGRRDAGATNNAAKSESDACECAAVGHRDAAAANLG